jgi:hypothetical protein
VVIAVGASVAIVLMALLLHDRPNGGGTAAVPARMEPAPVFERHPDESGGRQRLLPGAGVQMPVAPAVTDPTGVRDSSRSIEALLDRVYADTGEGASPVDRAELAAVLRADSAIRRAMGE